MNDNELLLSKRLTELANHAYQRGIPFFSDFLTLNEQDIFNKIINKMPPICIKAIGGYNLAERKIIAFYPDEYSQDFLPVECLCIKPISKKFSEELSHRDFLGALVNLGIDRSVLGDIVVSDNEAFLFCLDKISDFIISELVKIKHTAVMVERVFFDSEISLKTQEICGTVSSVRIDSVLSIATNLSRSKAINYIEEAKVFINGKLITTNSYNLKDNDIISVRGIGKFQYLTTTGTSKKGKTYIKLLKYN